MDVFFGYFLLFFQFIQFDLACKSIYLTPELIELLSGDIEVESLIDIFNLRLQGKVLQVSLELFHFELHVLGFVIDAVEVV